MHPCLCRYLKVTCIEFIWENFLQKNATFIIAMCVSEHLFLNLINILLKHDNASMATPGITALGPWLGSDISAEPSTRIQKLYTANCTFITLCVCLRMSVCVCACVTLISQISGEIPALPMLWPSCVIGTLHHGCKSGGISIILDLLPSTELWCSLANPRHRRNPILCLSTISCYTLLHANKFLILTNATILICISQFLMTYQCTDISISFTKYC